MANEVSHLLSEGLGQAAKISPRGGLTLGAKWCKIGSTNEPVMPLGRCFLGIRWWNETRRK
jgi:hypothetical protein